jgi:hypothetical protein
MEEPTMRDVICSRNADGTVTCSIPHTHTHHSPPGFEIGYGGSGPADLALNILAAALPRAKGELGVKLWDGSRVSDAAWDLHEAFKAELIATMPREGGILPGIVIEAWVTAKQHAQDTDDLPGS